MQSTTNESDTSVRNLKEIRGGQYVGQCFNSQCEVLSMTAIKTQEIMGTTQEPAAYLI